VLDAPGGQRELGAGRAAGLVLGEPGLGIPPAWPPPSATCAPSEGASVVAVRDVLPDRRIDRGDMAGALKLSVSVTAQSIMPVEESV
jgi:hypothetical protein